jgi:hypothetical protein
MKKRTSVAKRTVTEIHITDMFYTKPSMVLPFSQFREEPIKVLRSNVQAYAGQHKITEDAIVVVFEQRTISAEEQLKGGKDGNS